MSQVVVSSILWLFSSLLDASWPKEACTWPCSGFNEFLSLIENIPVLCYDARQTLLYPYSSYFILTTCLLFSKLQWDWGISPSVSVLSTLDLLNSENQPLEATPPGKQLKGKEETIQNAWITTARPLWCGSTSSRLSCPSDLQAEVWEQGMASLSELVLQSELMINFFSYPIAMLCYLLLPWHYVILLNTTHWCVCMPHYQSVRMTM